MNDYNSWSHAGWWKSKEERARQMTEAQLRYSRQDCHEAALAGAAPDKYRDEGSIYVGELRRRKLHA